MAVVANRVLPTKAGHGTSGDYRDDFRQFLSVGKLAGSLQAISVNLRPSECMAKAKRHRLMAAVLTPG